MILEKSLYQLYIYDCFKIVWITFIDEKEKWELLRFSSHDLRIECNHYSNWR